MLMEYGKHCCIYCLQAGLGVEEGRSAGMLRCLARTVRQALEAFTLARLNVVDVDVTGTLIRDILRRWRCGMNGTITWLDVSDLVNGMRLLARRCG